MNSVAEICPGGGQFISLYKVSTQAVVPLVKGNLRPSAPDCNPTASAETTLDHGSQSASIQWHRGSILTSFGLHFIIS